MIEKYDRGGSRKKGPKSPTHVLSSTYSRTTLAKDEIVWVEKPPRGPERTASIVPSSRSTRITRGTNILARVDLVIVNGGPFDLKDAAYLAETVTLDTMLVRNGLPGLDTLKGKQS
jgi:hypothetical protein